MAELNLTQEQLDKLVAEKLADARKGLFTEEDLQKKVTAEVDRRVETGIQKGLETHKKKWEMEFGERAKLSAEELAKKDFDEKLQTITQKELDIKRKANQLEAKSMLSEASIPKSHYEKFIGILVSDDEETTNANVTNFIEMFNSTKLELETKIKGEYSNVPKPDQGNNKPITKSDFVKMSYLDKIKFKEKYPDVYKEFIK